MNQKIEILGQDKLIDKKVFPHKFIVAKAKDGIRFYAHQVRYGGIKHSEIVALAKCTKRLSDSSKVIGGGYVGYKCLSKPNMVFDRETLLIGSESMDYGSVPREILEDLLSELLRVYQEIDLGLKKIEIDLESRVIDGWGYLP